MCTFVGVSRQAHTFDTKIYFCVSQQSGMKCQPDKDLSVDTVGCHEQAHRKAVNLLTQHVGQ